MAAYTDNPSAWSLRQEYYYESDVILNYIGSSRPAWAKEWSQKKSDIKPARPSKTTNKQKNPLSDIYLFVCGGAHAYVGSYGVRMFNFARNCQVIF